MLDCVGFWLRDAVASCECWATGRLMGTTYMESLIRAPCMEHLYNGILSTSYVSHRLEPMHGTDVHIHICLGSSEDLTCYMYVASCESHVGSAYTMVCEDVKPQHCTGCNTSLNLPAVTQPTLPTLTMLLVVMRMMVKLVRGWAK